MFVEEYVRSGDHLEAAKKAGYKDTHTLRNQACKLRRECADEITEELHRNFAEIAPRALNILSDLAENAESESVRLGATRDLLDRAGFRPVDRHEIVKEKSVEELNAQLVSLVGENGAEMLISTFRRRKSPSIENGKLYYKKDNTYENYFNSKYFSFCHTSLFQIKYRQM